MWGGCPARAPPPPDVNQVEIEVTWGEGKVHHEGSCDLRWSPSRGNGEPGAPLAPALRAPSPSIRLAVALSLPDPWIPICSGKPGSRSRPQVSWLGRRCLSPALGAGAASSISMGSSRWSTLPWEPCHLQCSP